MIFGTWPYTSIRASEMYEEIKKKRYFTTPELSRFNGKRASDKVAKFLRQTMVVESVARLDWQGVE